MLEKESIVKRIKREPVPYGRSCVRVTQLAQKKEKKKEDLVECYFKIVVYMF